MMTLSPDPVLGTTGADRLVQAPTPPAYVAPSFPPLLATQPQPVTLEFTKSALPQSIAPTTSHPSVAGTADTTLNNIVTMLVGDCKEEQAHANTLDVTDHKHQALQLQLQKAPCLPALPKLSYSKDWPDFIQTIEAYLSNTTYSPGGNGSCVKTAANKTASECLDTVMLVKLSGDGFALFKNKSATHIKQGFKKLVTPKTLFVNESMSALSHTMFEFFKGCAQGDLLPSAYKAKLGDSFEYFTKVDVPLPTIAQVMFMCCGLRDKYIPLLTKFKTLLYFNMTLKSTTDWCQLYDVQPPFIPVSNHRTGCRDSNASAAG